MGSCPVRALLGPVVVRSTGTTATCTKYRRLSAGHLGHESAATLDATDDLTFSLMQLANWGYDVCLGSRGSGRRSAGCSNHG